LIQRQLDLHQGKKYHQVEQRTTTNVHTLESTLEQILPLTPLHLSLECRFLFLQTTTTTISGTLRRTDKAHVFRPYIRMLSEKPQPSPGLDKSLQELFRWLVEKVE
jgi:hypothetical protein